MTNVNKTVAERLRETAENHVGVSTCTTMLNVIWDSSKCREGSCTDCRKKMLLTLADMIEAEQAELRAENERLCRDFYEPCARMGFTEHAHGIEVVFDAMSRAAQGHECRVDFKALELLCDKLDCGDVKRRSIAEQIRKAMSGAERLHEVNREVDVDALLKLADEIEDEADIMADEMQEGWVHTIRKAVKGAPSWSSLKGILAEDKRQLPEGIEWPRFEDGELVKFGDEVTYPDGQKHEVKHFWFENGKYLLGDSRFGLRVGGNYGEPVERPEPEVLDADGVPIKVGDTVYIAGSYSQSAVIAVNAKDEWKRVLCDDNNWHHNSVLTHRKPDTHGDIEDDATMPPWTYCSKVLNIEEAQTTEEMVTAMCKHLIQRTREVYERSGKLMGGE